MATTADELCDEVRRRYAESARAVSEGTAECGCGSGSCCGDGESDAVKFGEALYDAAQRDALPEAAALASLGCGNPTAVAELRAGETVLDLGSGRRYRPDPLGQARRPERRRVRAGHDGRDAGARAAQHA
jgi:arsenite methyltransferase